VKQRIGTGNLQIASKIGTLISLACMGWAALAAAGEDASKNHGAPTAPPPDLKFKQTKLNDNVNEGMTLADVNKDGKMDIVAGPYWYEAPDWKMHPLRKVLSRGQGITGFIQNNGDHAMDVNGDGWLDIVSGGWEMRQMFWYENPGAEGLKNEVEWKAHQITDGLMSTEATFLEDLDGDGMKDLILDNWNPNKPVVAFRFTRPAGGEPQWTRFVLGAEGCGHGMAIGDVNGDGKPDVICKIGWYENPGKDQFAAPWLFHQEFDLGDASTPCLVVDVNGDGKNDIIYGHGHDYGLLWIEQAKDPMGNRAWSWHTIDETFSQSHTLTWADIDGDGKPELITGKRVGGHGYADPGSREPTCLFRYQFDPLKREFVRHTIAFNDGVSTGMQINVFDFNGDGKLDIAVPGKTGTYVLIQEK